MKSMEIIYQLRTHTSIIHFLIYYQSMWFMIRGGVGADAKIKLKLLLKVKLYNKIC